MKSSFNKIVTALISGLILIICLFCFYKPAFAENRYTSMEVTPNTISFTITNNELDQNNGYYEADNKVTVISAQHFAAICFWFIGIRVEEQYLVDSFNPSNRIPISQLRWSRDGAHFTSLSNQWSLVNAYFDVINHTHEEIVTYRLYTNGSMLPAGSFSVRIDFDSRLQPFPWNK